MALSPFRRPYCIPPKRLFHIPTMSTVFYKDVKDDVKRKGYFTISHVWGDQQMYSANEFGIHNGVDWEIPLSNPNKISRLVDAIKHSKVEYCWWDILCMPQNKQDEINKEIPYMGHYYKGSAGTIILSDVNYDRSEDYWKWTKIMADTYEFNRRVTDEEREWLRSDACFYMLDFSKDPWFNRVWTFQEAVLSKYMYIFGPNGKGIVLHDLLSGVEQLRKLNTYASKIIFGGIMPLYKGVFSYLIGKICLTSALHLTIIRNCYKKQDIFYGVFGILEYTDFVVKYDIDMEDLNKDVAMYAYSKGDISWLSLGGYNENSFIQRMYEPFSTVGISWKGDPVVIFNGNTLCLNAATFIKISRQEKYSPGMNLVRDSLLYIIRKFKEWELRDHDIAIILTGYRIHSTIGCYIIKLYIRFMLEGLNDNEIMQKFLYILSEQKFREYFGPIRTIFLEILVNYGESFTIAEGIILGTNKHIPVIIDGNSDIGDEILLLKVHDEHRRSLGIVYDGIRRKGVCLYEKVEISDHMYTQHKFQL